MYLPHSQKYLAGCLAWRQPEFREYFEANRVQLPLAKGDAVFFNPAVFHAAGANGTAVKRMANLLLVSSALGRPTEAVDRSAISVAVLPTLLAVIDDGASPAMIANVIAACAESYISAAGLDPDQPGGGQTPPTQADILSRAVAESWSRQQLRTELDAWSARGQSR
jgi:ectoine hydroxylase-related dioxygenase (phytanoyl-CoA dioxygenase family)